MKSILLISANRFCNPYPVFPLGVAYLKRYLEKTLVDFKVEIFDCNLNTNEELVSLITSLKPSYVGVSLRNVDGANSLDRSSFIDGYKEIVSLVRESTSSPIIIGGAGFSIYPQAIFDALKPDFGIVGEGEESLYKLISALENGTDTSAIDGLVAYYNGSFVCNKHKGYLKFLDVHFDTQMASFYWQKSGMLNIQTKRGCPFDCIYCSYPIIDGRMVRTLDPDLIVDNIKRLKKETGINYLFFTDSVFNIGDKYNAELAEKFIQSKVDISWGAYFTPLNLTDEKLKLYKASGLTHIEFGTEAFCDSQLQNYGKRFTFSDVLNSSNLCLDNNIYYSHFLILGGYGESEKSLKETFENSKKISYSVFFPFMGMRIYPNTSLQRLSIAKGLISSDDPLLEPTYYLEDGFDIERTKQLALETGKAWIFPDDPVNEAMDVLRTKRNKKGVLWEYLRKP